MKAFFLIILIIVTMACLPPDEKLGPEPGFNSPTPGGAEEGDPDDVGKEENLPPSPILPVPSEVKGLLESVCGERPETHAQKNFFIDQKTGATPCEVDETTEEIVCEPEYRKALDAKGIKCAVDEISGEIICAREYTEVLVEEDQGDVISHVNLLIAKNDGRILKPENRNETGILYVEPSTDGHLYWAARKWTLAETPEIAKEAMKWSVTKTTTPEGEEVDVAHGIGIASYGEAFEGEGKGRLYVSRPAKDSPSSVTLIDDTGSVTDQPGFRHQICLVIKAPPQWTLDLENGEGPIVSLDHEAALRTFSFSGDIKVIKKGDGPVEATNDIGKIDLVQTGSGEISVEGSSGAISIIQKGSGKVMAYNANETISVTAGSNVPVELMTEYGAIDYFVQEGGVRITDSWITSDSGAINVHLDPGIGFDLDAQTEVGSISLPSGFPQPEKVGLTGEKVVGGIRGGGGPLFLRSYAGSICLEDMETGGQSNDCPK